MKKILKVLLFIFAFLVAVPTCMAKDYLLNIEERQTYKESEDKQVMLKKEITSIDKKTGKIEVEVTLNNSKNAESVEDDAEIWLVLDNSWSMDYSTDSGAKRKDVVSESAKKLVEKLLDKQFNIKIGVLKFNGESGSLFGYGEDSTVLIDLSNDKEKIIAEIEKYKTSSCENGTNIDAGITKAYENFSDQDNKKIIFLLTDGVPTTAIDKINNKYDNTKNKIISIEQSGIYVISLMTGLDSTDQYYQSDKEIVERIFGTPENPTAGTFYNIQDSDISNIVENNVYNDITATFEQPIHDITIKDSFLKETLENFTFDFVENSKGDTDKTLTDNTLNLTLDELAGSSKVTLKYTLTAKNMKNDSLKGKSFKTNDKVVVTYKDINYNDHEIVLDTSPSISFIEDKVENPDTGLNNYIIITVSIALVIGSITYLKFNKRKEG